MEIFERMAWYGFFALSSLYITGSTETGALGFTSEERGAIQAMIPFLLYLMPVATGALADRYGFKRMFLISYVGMIVSYYALGQFKSLPTFMLAFFFVAVAAAIFKPVVVGTVARVTTAANSRLGFGIFYMMVNVGGFLGPIVAGLVRGVSWNYMFVASSAWAVINLVICTLLYKEPPKPPNWRPSTVAQLGQTIYEVLGNLRFFLTVMVVVIAMMVAQFGPWWFQWWPHAAIFIPAWIVLNFVWDTLLPVGSGRPRARGEAVRNWFAQRMHCSDWRFALFLLILSGFWTSFNQIFLTMPEYIRDFSETSSLVRASRTVLGDGAARKLASVEENEFYAEIDDVLRRAMGHGPLVEPDEEEKSEKEIAGDNRKELEDLVKTAHALVISRHLPEADRESVRQLAGSLKAVSVKDADAVAGALEQHREPLQAFERVERLVAFRTFPGITPEITAKLGQITAQLNRQGIAPIDDKLEVLDLLDSSRKVLDYKVRFAPVQYAELIAGIEPEPRTPSDEALQDALEALNKRLRDVQQPKFESTGASQVKEKLGSLLARHGVLLSADTLAEAAGELSTEYRKVDPKVLAVGWKRAAFYDPLYEAIDEARQFNPEFIVNINALGIVIFQVLISYLISRFHQFTGMIIGMVVAAVGIGLSAFAGDHGMFGMGGAALVVCAGILTFSFGEMMASPTSQEYVGRIAPDDKKALYMGYYFVAVALGNLFGGILSGQLYGKLARDAQRPDLMWLAFGGIMLLTAVIFLMYNRFALPKTTVHELTSTSAEPLGRGRRSK
jgi:MFS family permease